MGNASIAGARGAVKKPARSTARASSDAAISKADERRLREIGGRSGARSWATTTGRFAARYGGAADAERGGRRAATKQREAPGPRSGAPPRPPRAASGHEGRPQ